MQSSGSSQDVTTSDRVETVETPKEQRPCRSGTQESIVRDAVPKELVDVQESIVRDAVLKELVDVKKMLLALDRGQAQLNASVGSIVGLLQHRVLNGCQTPQLATQATSMTSLTGTMSNHQEHQAAVTGQGLGDTDDDKQRRGPNKRCTEEQLSDVLVEKTSIKMDSTSWECKPKWPSEQQIDNVVNVLIALNSLAIGLATDLDTTNRAWLAIKCIFAMLFWVELLLRAKVMGPHRYFCGENALASIFDAALIVIDTVEIILSMTVHTLVVGDWVILLRMFRLLRLVRLVQIFKTPFFRDLFAIISGLLSGMGTLMGVGGFYVCFIYIVSLVFRAVFGPDPMVEAERKLAPEDMQWYFETLPRAMLTTFRCSFGDCSTMDGTPILGSTFGPGNGAVINVAMALFIFFTTVGLMNVISALFLERIMTNAQKKTFQEQHERLNNRTLFNRKTQNFLCMLHSLQRETQRVDTDDASDQTNQEYTTIQERELKSKGWFLWPLRRLIGKSKQQHSLTSSQQLVDNQSFTREVVDRALDSDKVKQILADLDIDFMDCLTLSDTLDMDNNGIINGTELIQGLSRLRGPARRSDIVTVDLQVRYLQKSMDKLLGQNVQQQPIARQQGTKTM